MCGSGISAQLEVSWAGIASVDLIVGLPQPTSFKGASFTNGVKTAKTKPAELQQLLKDVYALPEHATLVGDR